MLLFQFSVSKDTPVHPDDTKINEGLRWEYQGHWTERGRAASVANSDVTDRRRRSVLAFGASHPG
jgi:hypothetical protein